MNKDIEQLAEERIHELKTWPEYFQAVKRGEKRYEVRKNDRDFKVGDILVLKEGDFGGNGMTDYDLTFVYTGEELKVRVTHVLYGGRFGIAEGFCVLSIEPYNEALQSSTLRWVKASERLPEIIGDYFVKTKFGNRIHYFNGFEWPAYADPENVIEWLEESVDKEGRDLLASDLYCNNSIEKSLFMHDTINNEVVEFGTAKDVEEYIIKNFTEGKTAHPDYWGFDLFVKVGIVDAGAKVRFNSESNPTPFNSSKEIEQ